MVDVEKGVRILRQLRAIAAHRKLATVPLWELDEVLMGHELRDFMSRPIIDTVRGDAGFNVFIKELKEAISTPTAEKYFECKHALGLHPLSVLDTNDQVVRDETLLMLKKAWAFAVEET
jgi:hypothetical protein